MLVDGRYDAFILWADTRDDTRNDARDGSRDNMRGHVRTEIPDQARDNDHAPARDAPRVDAGFEGGVEFQLAITAGAHKGEVIELVASNFATRDPIELVGLPCTLVVDNGTPRIEP